MIKADTILFIKLGNNGCYEKECIEIKNTIRLDYREIDHSLCINKKWNLVEKKIEQIIKTDKSHTTSHKNQIRRFYEEPNTTMWITFYDGKLWYCFADTNIVHNTIDNTKERKVIGKWQDVDLNNKTLFIQSLSGRLTKVQGFRGTICEVKEKSYLLNKINCIQSPELLAIEQSIASLKISISNLIKKLNPKDFEVFVDLIFRSAGWSRIGVLGKTTKNIDIELYAPVTNERIIVQIKAQSDLQTFHDYENRLSLTTYDRAYFIVHTPTDALKKFIDNGNETDIEIWDVKKLSELSVNSGLLQWLINIAE